MLLYKDTKASVRSPDYDFLNIVATVLQGEELASFLLIICLDYVLRKSIDRMKNKWFHVGYWLENLFYICRCNNRSRTLVEKKKLQKMYLEPKVNRTQVFSV